jgi:hypothetical protein
MKPTASKKPTARKRKATPPRPQKAMIELTRGQAYALLAGASAALECGVTPPEKMHRDLFDAIFKFRRAFKFTAKEKY